MALALGSIDSSATSMAGDPVDSEQSRHEPEKSGQECKGNVGLELATLVSGDGVNIVPVEDVAAGVAQHLDKRKSASGLSVICERKITYVDQEAKGCPPAKAEDNIDWPMNKRPREWNEPYQRKEHGQCRYDFGIDEAALRPVGRMAVLVKVLACHSSDNGSEDELCRSEDNVDDAIQRHCDDSFWCFVIQRLRGQGAEELLSIKGNQ